MQLSQAAVSRSQQASLRQSSLVAPGSFQTAALWYGTPGFQSAAAPSSHHHHNRRPEHTAPVRSIVLAAQAADMVAPLTYLPPIAKTLVLEVGGQKITLETGEIGRQANGAIMATMGETMLYTTACCSAGPAGDGSFLPFTVNYAERFSAIGKTSGGYVKRDGRPKDWEVLVSRLVDRPLRPMFANGWSNDTQVLQWVLSYDGENQTEPLAITAAAAALLISDIPLNKAVAGVRVGLIDGQGFVINPTTSQMARSKIDLIVAGTRDAVLMIEGFADFVSEEDMLQAVAAGQEAISSMCVQLEAWAAEVGKAKSTRLQVLPGGLTEVLRQAVGPQLQELCRSAARLFSDSCGIRRSVLPKEARSSLESQLHKAAEAAAIPSAGSSGDGIMQAVTPVQVSSAFKELYSSILRQHVLQTGRRIDGRSLTDIRPISSRAGFLPRAHGSSLFTRGETQALCVATLGSENDAQKMDSIRAELNGGTQRFCLQYHFPPSSVGETGRTGAPGRRELGHGELAQRALAPIAPDESSFPYTIRIESTITESNGSSSMASVCGGCLAMMDAGVPIRQPVAGIAMGLILEPNGQFAILSDILGTEDALGDMDFKVAGDADTITAFQMDIKVEGITLEIMRAALAQAKEGRRHILGEMAKCNPPPRAELSAYVPAVVRSQYDATKKAVILGASGRNIKSIIEASGVTSISLEDDGQVEVCAPSRAAAERALEYIQLISDDPPVNKIFRKRKVASLAAFGVFVELGPGRQGLVHVSELDITPMREVGSAFKVGDEIDVMVLSCDHGKLALSRKAVLIVDSGAQLADPGVVATAPQTPERPAAGRGDRGRGGGRGSSAGGRGMVSGRVGSRRQ